MKPIRILLQTTIPTTPDDWSIARFGLLTQLLSRYRLDGSPTFDVTARDRGPKYAPDPVLSELDRSNFDQLWLFAVDEGDGLHEADCEAISRFRRRGGGLLVCRDHQDLGSSICSLSGVGAAHHFHTRNLHPDPATHVRDDQATAHITWPNYHSGANGDYQLIRALEPVHAVLSDPTSPNGAIRHLPAHPHEGLVDAPPEAAARVIADGISAVSEVRFNLSVAFEASADGGRALAQSTFHHFCDYNWDPRAGAPSFVDEPEGSGMINNRLARADVERFSTNVALWLSEAL